MEMGVCDLLVRVLIDFVLITDPPTFSTHSTASKILLASSYSHPLPEGYLIRTTPNNQFHHLTDTARAASLNSCWNSGLFIDTWVHLGLNCRTPAPTGFIQPHQTEMLSGYSSCNRHNKLSDIIT